MGGFVAFHFFHGPIYGVAAGEEGDKDANQQQDRRGFEMFVQPQPAAHEKKHIGGYQPTEIEESQPLGAVFLLGVIGGYCRSSFLIIHLHGTIALEVSAFIDHQLARLQVPHQYGLGFQYDFFRTFDITDDLPGHGCGSSLYLALDFPGRA
ncbi:MAG: hypothetical protein ABI036_12715 [Fibrobacteria bacterium]